jgi:hypothetical protein
MAIKIHPHAREGMHERGASEKEAILTIEKGEKFPAKFGRTGFRHNFPFHDSWRGTKYNTKQVEVYAVQEREDWVIITIIAKYF